MSTSNFMNIQFKRFQTFGKRAPLLSVAQAWMGQVLTHRNAEAAAAESSVTTRGYKNEQSEATPRSFRRPENE